MTVPFLDLRSAHEELADEIEEATRRVVASGRYLLGPELEAFEAEWAAYCGNWECVGVGSGLDALRLALVARGIGPGDEVIVPGHTFIATWLAVSAAGATPIPVDVDPECHHIDPCHIDVAVTRQTKAIIAVDLYGDPAPYDELRPLCERHGLWLLADAAQSHGARLNGVPAATLADAACWSFYPGKNLGALGDGGAVTTNDPELARELRRLRNYGSSEKYVHEVQGVNSRLDELQAAVLRVKLGRLAEWNERRAHIAWRYARGLADASVELPAVRAGAEPAWHLFPVRSADRGALRQQLTALGIETVIHYPIPPHRQAAYAGSAAARARLPVTERVTREVMSLPIGPHLEPAEADRVIDAVLTLGGAPERNGLEAR